MMYVVRIDLPDGREPNFKAFERLPDARKRLTAASSRVLDGDALGAFLFEVAGESDPRKAITAIKEGVAVLLERDPWKRIVGEMEADLARELGMPDA